MRFSRKAFLVLVIGLFAWLLTACSPSAEPDDVVISANMKKALEGISGVTKAEARYTIIKGMGATMFAQISIKADNSTQMIDIFKQALKSIIEPTASVDGSTRIDFGSIPNGKSTGGQDPTDLGLAQKPTLIEIRKFFKQN